MTFPTQPSAISIRVLCDPADGSINLYLRSTRRSGGHFKPPRLVKFRAKLADAWHAAANGQTMTGRLELTIACFYKRRSKVDPSIDDLAFGDADSPIKAIQDSVKDAGIIVDDVIIVRVSSEKFLDRKNPRVEATLSRRTTFAPG